MNFSLSISPIGSLLVHKTQDPDNTTQPDFSFVKKAQNCKTAQETIQLLAALKLPSNSTEYNNVHFIQKIETYEEEKYKPCSIEKMMGLAISALKINEVEEEKFILSVGMKKVLKNTNVREKTSQEKEPWKITCASQADKEVQAAKNELKKEIDDFIDELKNQGPYLRHRPHFDSLHNQPGIPMHAFHCHITDGSPTYVGCWSVDKKTREITLFYVGTHEQAPYQ